MVGLGATEPEHILRLLTASFAKDHKKYNFCVAKGPLLAEHGKKLRRVSQSQLLCIWACVMPLQYGTIGSPIHPVYD